MKVEHREKFLLWREHFCTAARGQQRKKKQKRAKNRKQTKDWRRWTGQKREQTAAQQKRQEWSRCREGKRHTLTRHCHRTHHSTRGINRRQKNSHLGVFSYEAWLQKEELVLHRRRRRTHHSSQWAADQASSARNHTQRSQKARPHQVEEPHDNQYSILDLRICSKYGGMHKCIDSLLSTRNTKCLCLLLHTMELQWRLALCMLLETDNMSALQIDCTHHNQASKSIGQRLGSNNKYQ